MTLIRIHLAIAMLKAARWLHSAAYALTDAAAAIITKAEQIRERLGS